MGSAERGRHYTVSEGVIVERIDGEAVALDLSRNVYFGLGPMAQAIWTMLEQDESVEGVIARLCDRYGEPVERVTRDVEAFLSEIERHGLMRRLELEPG